LTFTFAWDLQTPKSWASSRSRRILFQGWQISGFLTDMSGLPVDIYDPAGGSLYGQVYGARPTWAVGASRSSLGHAPAGYYFNPFAFTQALVQPGAVIPSAHDGTALASDFGTAYGNVGRNVLRGPSQRNMDLSVMKSFRVRESKNLDFRADFFNAANNASKSNPISDISASKIDPATGVVIDPGNFGRILGSDSSPRIIQFGLAELADQLIAHKVHKVWRGAGFNIGCRQFQRRTPQPGICNGDRRRSARRHPVSTVCR